MYEQVYTPGVNGLHILLFVLAAAAFVKLILNK